MSLYLLIAIVLASFLSGGATAWKVQGWRHDAQEKERLEVAAEKRRNDSKHIDTAAAGHEKDRAALRKQFEPITKEVDRVVEKPDYRGMCLDDDGLRALRSAIGASAPSEPAGAMPRPEQPD